MDLRIDGLRAVVTGAAGGIGAAVTRALAAEGVAVAALDRVEAAVDAVPAPHTAGATSAAIKMDVTDEASVARGVADAAAALGGIDLLVCAAGVSGPVGTPLADTTREEWDAVFGVNVTGTFLTLRACVPWLAASTSAAVVVVSSDSAFVATAGMTPYGASKAAVLQLARAAAVELQPDGIRVTAICPSIVDTAMSRGDLGLAAGFDGAPYPVQTADEVAQTVVYLLSPGARAITATAVVSDFGYSARSNFPA